MFLIDRAEGEAVHLGRYVLRVLEIHDDEVVFGLFDPDEASDEHLPATAVED